MTIKKRLGKLEKRAGIGDDEITIRIHWHDDDDTDPDDPNVIRLRWPEDLDDDETDR